jgi:predicted ribosomally synthesized peptide with SipW-like signal peptide
VKKIIGLTIAALLLIGAVGASTWAAFQDTEKSSNNTLTAGTLDLNINNGNIDYTMFTLTNIKPGDTGNYIAPLRNNGSLGGKLTVTSALVSHSAGAAPVPADPDIVPTDVLYTTAQIALYIDVDNSGTWNAGDIGLRANGTTYTFSDSATLLQAPMNSYLAATWTDAVANLAVGATNRFVVNYSLPLATGNNCQGGSAVMSFTFVLNQLP